MQVAPIAVVPRWRTLPVALAGIGAVCAVASVAVAMSGEPTSGAPTSVTPTVRAPVMVVPEQVAPGACTDPVVGIWRAHEFRPGHEDWTEHQIHIVKQDDGYVVEHIARVRDGDRNGPARFSCMPDAIEFNTVGRARLDGDQLHVWGEELLKTRARCDGARLSYDLDSFTGRVSGDSFDSVNNDGGTARNRRYRFRRIACE